MILDTQLMFVVLALPALFGLTFVGEGVYRISHYESGIFNIIMGTIVLACVAFGYFYLNGMIG